MSPARIRSRSRALLPYVCTIRSRSSCTAFSAPTASVSSASNWSLIMGAGIGRSSIDTGAVGGVFTSRSMALITKGRKPGLFSWWKATPSTPQPHHFMCLTSGMPVVLLCSEVRVLRLVGAVGGGVVDESGHLFGNAFVELSDRFAVFSPHRFAKRDKHRRPAVGWPVLAVRHGLSCANDGNRQARHIPTNAQCCGPGLEGAHLTGPGSRALGKEQQRYAVVKQAGSQPMPAAQPSAVDRKRIEEQRGETLAPPHVEEIVGGGSGGDVAGELAR